MTSDEAERVRKNPNAANLILVKNSHNEDSFDWWFNYNYHYTRLPLEQVLLECKMPQLWLPRKQLRLYVIIKPPTGWLPALYLGDGTAKEQMPIKQGMLVDKGRFNYLWPVFAAYARML